MAEEDKRRQHAKRGPVGDQVAENLARFRSASRKTTSDLAEHVSQLGVPMTASTVTKIETQQRRVTVDELVAFAAALNVSPVTLMLPASDEGRVPLADGLTANWYNAWTWMHGVAPLVDPSAKTFRPVSLQWLAINQPYLSAEKAAKRTSTTAFQATVGQEEDDGPGS
ncbi:helix-turn-helix domain-containing protein [Streptomyces sp. NPDC057740]|uniref:helix-turn-helix domain-containing protein n=1 Tax=Streptomyces sp. NPDC057740 TaxID=3346234 RepID=UPI0036B35139